MKDLGFKLTELRHIHFDMLDIRERQKRPDVLELAASRAKIALHPITVHAGTKQLVAGRDRLAADLLNKVTRAPVRWLDGSEAEMLDIEVEENLHRRNDNRDELIARRVTSVTKEVELADKMPGKSPGRPKTAKGAAREKVAAALGTTSEAVRSAESRAARPAPASIQELPPPIALKERKVSPDWLSRVREVQEAVDVADKAGRAMQAALTKLASLPFPGGPRARFEKKAHELTADIRALRPRSVCSVEHAVGIDCKLCYGMGWLGADADAIQDSVTPIVVPAAWKGKAAADVGVGRTKASAAKKLVITDDKDQPIAAEADEVF